MFNPKVSIIIPVYNGSDFLSESIQSALDQDYKNIEVIVIDDGSNDNWATENIIMSFWSKVIHLKKNNGWVATALNLWITHMSWEYFSWLSHDDIYAQNKISRQIELLKNINNKENIIIFSDYIFMNEQWKEINKIQIQYRPEQILYKLLINSFLNGCTLLIPKKAFQKVWGFDSNLKTTQDYHLWFRMMKYYTFIRSPYYLVKSRQHAMQDSKNKLFLAIKERRELENFIFSIYKISELKKSAESSLPDNIFSLLLHIKLQKYRVLWFLYFIAKKLHIDLLLATIYRKVFKY